MPIRPSLGTCRAQSCVARAEHCNVRCQSLQRQVRNSDSAVHDVSTGVVRAQNQRGQLRNLRIDNAVRRDMDEAVLRPVEGEEPLARGR